MNSNHVTIPTFRRALFRSVAFSSFLVPALMFTPAAQAQVGEDQVSDVVEADAARTLQTVTVTARKREESLTDVPVSITAVGAAQLEQAGVTDLTELFQIVPGAENNADGERIADKPAIRGVGSQENASIRAKVTSFIDGIPMSGSQGIGSFAGLQQVEVLRGPQSAAFGRSTFGGAFNYVTADPTLGDPISGKLRGSYGTNEAFGVSGLVAIPLGDTAALQFTAERNSYGGDDDWITTSGDQLGKSEDTLLSAKLVWELNSNLRLEVLAMTQDIDDSQMPILLPNTNQLVAAPGDPDGMCAINGGGNSCVILGEIDTDAVPRIFDFDYGLASNPITNPGTRIERDRIQATVTGEVFDGYTWTISGAYTDEAGVNWIDRDFFSVGAVNPLGGTFGAMSTIHVHSSPEIEETYGEIRLASPSDGQFNWLVGASVYEYDYLNLVRTNFSTNQIMDTFSEGARNTGFFFNLGYDFTDRLTGSFEGRYQIDEIDTGSAVSPGLENTTRSFQPRVALNYEVSDAMNLYAQIARGTNPAGFNVNAASARLQATAAEQNFDLQNLIAFDEEEIVNYEVGAKGSTNTFRYSASVYYLDWTGYVQPGTTSWDPGNLTFPRTVGTFTDINGTDYFSRFFSSAGDLSGLGGEVEGTWAATDELELSGSFAYSGVEFDDTACSAIPLDYGIPAESTLNGTNCAFIGGNAPPMFSRYSTSLSGVYTRPLSNGLDGFVRLAHSWRSKRYVEQTNFEYIGDYHTLNANIGVRGDNWSAEFYGKNLTDDDTAAGAVRFFDARLPGMVFNSSFTLRRPLEVGIRLGYDF
jgi:iron complex outermembrane recepter protein